MVLDGDSPRVHVNDPVTSHLAADKSQRTVHSVRDRVLQLISEQGPMAAFEVCNEYAERADWPKVHHESPRKRMSDMKREGLLVETGETRINGEGSPEVVVAIAEAVTQ
jgi:hypothetical protein